MEQSFMDTTKVDLVQETLGTSEEQLLLIIQAYEMNQWVDFDTGDEAQSE